MSLNIWMINHYAIGPESAGGTRHYTLAKYLDRKGHRVQLVASAYNHWTRRDDILDPDEQWKRSDVAGVSFVWLRTPPYRGNVGRMKNMFHFAWQVFRGAWSRGLESPDLVMASSPHLFAALAALVLARRRNCPFVLEVRDLWPQTLVDLGNISRRHPLVLVMAALEKYLYRKADQIVTLLPGAVEYIAEKGGAAGRISWIPNGVDLEMFPEARPYPRKKPFTLIYAGSFGLANGLDTILDTAAVLQQEGYAEQVRFRLIGNGPNREDLLKRVEQEQLKNVFIEDPVPKNKIHAELVKADAFIVTLVSSGLYKFGISLNKLYDYMALGKPTVFGSDALNNPIAEAGAGLIVPPQDAVAMAEAVKQLLSLEPGELEAMGIKGRRFVETNHAFDRLSDRLEAVFLTAVKERHNEG